MQFNEWLRLQTARDDDVGAIARVSVRGVTDWPSSPRVRQSELRRYLRTKFDCCLETVELLDRMLIHARSEWRAERVAA